MTVRPHGAPARRIPGGVRLGASKLSCAIEAPRPSFHPPEFTAWRKNMKIMMRNLSRDTTEAELLILFKEYGEVQYCKLVMDKVTGKSKGFGFVEMPRVSEAKAAIKELNYRDVGGNKIRVKKAEMREKSANGNDSGTPVS